MIGVDTVAVPRITAAICSDAFVKRVYTPYEQQYCVARPNPHESFAGLFCAKEAVVKALKTGFGNGIMPNDIEIVHDKSGAPKVVAHGEAARLLQGKSVELSVSHDGGFAIAVAIIIGG